MIINNTHRFVFVHIPKCAGTTVRGPLQEFDDYKGAHTGRVACHPVLGNLDYVHIPLFTLRDHFKEEFKSVRDYWSFAVIRDPFSRFPSSVSQRIKNHADKPIHRCSLDEVKKAIDESLEFLSKQARGNHCLPPEYIHFQKQVDYIELDGEQIVDSLYKVDDVDILFKEVSQRVGKQLGQCSELPDTERRNNQSIVFRNDFLRRLFEIMRPATKQLSGMLNEEIKQRVRDQVYVPRDRRTKDLFNANYLKDFIRDYYAEDIALYEKVGQKNLEEA